MLSHTILRSLNAVGSSHDGSGEFCSEGCVDLVEQLVQRPVHVDEDDCGYAAISLPGYDWYSVQRPFREACPESLGKPLGRISCLEG